ncbi:hypothetical protein [Nocardiopsis algeriensis]|uniref:Uncharacterized protein n=1 Tax=Nocardiopsis algeriensis TaxID=1478215 RepID=A0A841IVB6_9ACTN|nr:hypothetical protein [Nocardiopsis algeriensis]MBB6122200.1 hypothetical protein [Nocardiopsis algeriensis]
MKLLKKTTDPMPTAPTAASGLAGWFTPTRLVVAAAAVPSLLSLMWVANTAADIIGNGPAGWAAGVFADVLIVSTVLVAWVAPDVRRLASIGGWIAAAAAGLLLGCHHWGTEQVAFALVPIGSKFLWHIALAARTAWEQRRDADRAAAAQAAEKERLEAEEAAQAERDADRERELALSTDLTEDEKRELAEIRRQAAYARAKAEAEMELTAAQAEADRMRQQADADAERIRQEAEHQMRQEALQRQVEAQLAAQRADAELLKQRFALEQELTLMRPIGAGPAIGNERVPDDASAITDGPFTAGFGFPQSTPARRVPAVDDRTVPRVPTPGSEGERNRAAVLAAYKRLAATGATPSVSAIATEAGVSRRTVNRHLPPQMRG